MALLNFSYSSSQSQRVVHNIYIYIHTHGCCIYNYMYIIYLHTTHTNLAPQKPHQTPIYYYKPDTQFSIHTCMYVSPPPGSSHFACHLGNWRTCNGSTGCRHRALIPICPSLWWCEWWAMVVMVLLMVVMVFLW
jgi:hypothetical protein